MTDKALMDLYENRAEVAIDATRERYGAYCRTIIWNILRSEEDTEECLSDVWLRVWNAIPPQRVEHFKGWLGTIARNCALTACASRGRRPEQMEDGLSELLRDLADGPAEQLEAKVLGEAISSFLYTRPVPERTAFLRRYWYGDTIEETANRLGWTVGKTKTTLFRTRRRLRSFLEKEELYHE